MPIDKAMELIYIYLHEQSEAMTAEQIEAFNLGLSALKTIADFKLNNVSRETILGRKLIALADYNCSGIDCPHCKYYDTSYDRCPSTIAMDFINIFDNNFRYADTDSTHQNEKETKA